MSSRKQHHYIDLPGHLSDESAAEISEFLDEITRVFETRYYAQIKRHYDNLRADMMCSAPAHAHPAPGPDDPEAEPF